MPFTDPANDNDDPTVLLARKIARVVGFVVVVGLAVYLFRTYVTPS
jgi:hypothetical protein